MELPFWKAESAGNDFVLVHAAEFMHHTDFLEHLARFVSPRRTGIGSDGLLALAPTAFGLQLRMFNPDGTEDFCGNGLRIAARHGFDQDWVPREFSIHHLDREVPCWISENGSARTQIGSASFLPDRVPIVLDEELFMSPIEVGGEELEASAVTTGSTHTVILVDELPGDERFQRMSRQLELSPLFPQRTSVIWTLPVSDRDLKIRIWERGAGETLGCGTGSSAAAAVWFRKRGLSGAAEVQNPGGSIHIEMASWDAPITVESIPRETYAGAIELPTELSSMLRRSAASPEAFAR